MSVRQLDIRQEIAAALQAHRPVVALESTLIAHGLPYPLNRDTACAAEAAVRENGATPATVAVWRGRPTVGLSLGEIEVLAQEAGVLKASRRDLALAMTQGRTAATTVAGTMALAHLAGIRVFATGGIGGVHRGWQSSADISADLLELARTPVAVVCAGAKSILDIPATLEMLETLGVPVIGYGTDKFPGFYIRASTEAVSARLDTPDAVALFCRNHWELGGRGIVIAQTAPAALTLTADEFGEALRLAEDAAAAANIRGPALTPFLLARLGEITQSKTLEVNRALVIENARLAAAIAVHVTRLVKLERG